MLKRVLSLTDFVYNFWKIEDLKHISETFSYQPEAIFSSVI